MKLQKIRFQQIDNQMLASDVPASIHFPSFIVLQPDENL